MSTIDVSELIGSPLALSGTDGKLVFETAIEALKTSAVVTIDVTKLNAAITAFFRASFGMLYQKLGPSEYKTRIIPCGIETNADFKDKYCDVLEDVSNPSRSQAREQALDEYFSKVC